MSGDIGKIFMERTKYEHIGIPDQARGLPPPPVELPYEQSAALVELPDPRTVKVRDVGLRQAIEARRSVRKYSRQPLKPAELSFLLWCTQGIREVIQKHTTLRTVPSAGARHALETFLVVNNVESIDPGLYRFLPVEHKLLSLPSPEDLPEKFVSACLGQTFVRQSAATFIWAAAAYRMTWRYGQRGYRYLHLDAGHACQNLYLSAEAVGCGVCAVAAFSDDQVNEILGLDGNDLFAIYLAAVGKAGEGRG